jgi:PPM family protein phosphatase
MIRIPEIKTGAASDIGRVRKVNEDAYGVFPELGLLVVSDGMGGHRAGEVASRTVVRWFPRFLKKLSFFESKEDPSALSEKLRDAVVRLGREMRRISRSRRELWGMGATLVSASFLDSFMLVTNMGDSRAYLFRDGRLSRLTRDHSLAALLVEEGMITPEEASNHSSASKLTRYMGMEIDVHPDIYFHQLQPADRVLLCTDGLTGELKDSQISEIMNGTDDPQQICEQLTAAAHQAGGKDNITAVAAVVS